MAATRWFIKEGIGQRLILVPVQVFPAHAVNLLDHWLVDSIASVKELTRKRPGGVTWWTTASVQLSIMNGQLDYYANWLK